LRRIDKQKMTAHRRAYTKRNCGSAGVLMTERQLPISRIASCCEIHLDLYKTLWFTFCKRDDF